MTLNKEKNECGRGCKCGEFARKIMLTLLGILLVYIIILVGSIIRNNLQKYNYIGRADRSERAITIQGTGKVTAKPDIAVTSMGMISSAKTVSEAQQKNTAIMNKLIEKLKALGIDSKDIQTTNYNIYPQYDYLQDKGQVLRGYEVNQSVTIKIRDLTKANQVLALAGEVGTNNVSGLQFTIDDNEIYKVEARKLALEKIAEKAKTLTNLLGVKVVGVVSYNEYEGSGGIYPMKAYADSSIGMGGGAPAVESGSTDVTINASVTLEIR